MSKLIARTIEEQVLENLVPNKAIALLGPRLVGKTVLIHRIMKGFNEPYLLLNGEDMDVRQILAQRSTQHYLNLLGNSRILIIDEAQRIPEVGKILTLMVDEIEGIRILVTGSSAFDLNHYTGEPLIGRKKTFHLFALSEEEFNTLCIKLVGILNEGIFSSIKALRSLVA